MRIVDTGDGWKEARVGERVVLRFKLPPKVTTMELFEFCEHLKKLAQQMEHGPS